MEDSPYLRSSSLLHVEDGDVREEDVALQQEENFPETAGAESNSRFSTDSTSTYEIVDCHSPESNDEMWSNVVKITRATNATVAAMVGSAAGQEEEVDEDRDRDEEEGQEYDIRDGEEDLLQQRPKFELVRSSTKEEKQRQNEEILIMKSNSVSSENNSWETFSPSKPVTGETFETAEPVEIPSLVQSKPGTSKACFIDASSLFDEDEVPFPSFVDSSLQRQQQEKTSISLSAILSDDEKLKSSNGQAHIDVKDQYSSVPDNDFLTNKLHIKERETVECSEESIARQEAERKQGSFLFQNSIQQYSGHSLEPNLQFPEENFSDMSLPSVYSSSSEPNYEYSSLALDNSARFMTTGGINTSGYNSGSADYSSRVTHSTDQENSHYPDTPFNSIVHVNSAVSIHTTAHRLTEDSRESSVDRESHSTPIKIPKRMQKHDESAPIVSGGASIEDFTPKLCESPSIRRRTDTCPIVSGGMSFEETFRPEERPRRLSSSAKSWVVDLKNCPDDEKSAAISSIEHNRSGLGFFVDLGSIKTPEEEKSIVVNNKPQNRAHQDLMKKSTGFYIDLSDGDSSRSNTPKLIKPETPPVKSGSSCNSSRAESVEKDAKKNMFSMFIDIGSSDAAPKPSSAPRRLSASSALAPTKEESPVMPVPIRPANLGSDEKKNCYMFIESDSTPIVRRSNPPSVAKNESKRHSWNPSTTEGTFHERRIMNREYQRSTSVTSDKGIMNILDKIPFLSKTSSMSIDSSVSPFEDFTCSKSELSTYSNHSMSSNSAHSSNDSKVSPKDATGAGAPEMTASAKKKRKDVKINETFDKSSQGSVTDGILSSNEDSSPVSTTTDTDDVTFQNNPADEPNAILPVDPQSPEPVQEIKLPPPSIGKQMETIVEAVESSPKHLANGNNRQGHHTMETLHATIEKQKQLLETVSENVESQSTSFVKLSDMDKPPVAPAKFELHSTNGNGSSGGSTGYMSNSAGSNRVARLFGDTHKYNTIGPSHQTQQQLQQQQQQQQQHNYYANGTVSMERHSWNMSRSTGNNFMNLVSSVENSRSLSRLFPHLSKAFSNSLPSDVGMNVLNEFTTSDFSCTSSITSSRSGIESIDESISSRQPRRLGEDLLKMFLQEIATDVTIEAESKKMRAHKCILRSRCQYFAAILAGGWVQNAGNVISLPGYSYAAVHFALCHIYSGASHPPEGISLMELAALSDLLGLEGLKEVTAYALRTNYCHNFHKPCSGCTDGVLQVLPVTLNHGLDELYRKCLKWVCRHYMKIWSNKQFSQLPADVVNRCRQQIVAHLTSETVLNTILDSEQLLTVLHPYKWSVEVENVVRDILDAAYDYIQDHFASLLASDSFLSLGQNYSWAISHVEPILLRAATSLSPDQACKSYPRATRLHKLLQAKVLTMTTTPSSNDSNVNILNVYDKKKLDIDYTREEEEMDWCDEFVGMVNAILSAVEQCLIRQCARAMRVNSWQRMDVELRNKIQKLACLMEPAEDRKSRSRYSYSSQTSSSSSIHSRTNDLRQVRLAIQAHTKRSYENQSNNVNNKTTTQHTQTVVLHNDLNNVSNNHRSARSHEINERNNIRTDHPVTENGKLSKTASKSNVPAEPKPNKAPIKVGLLSKNNLSNHKRSQSEDMGSKVAKPEPLNNLKNKLNNVKPRYLEPKKPKNTSNLQVQNLSSSGSSTRTSSPATGRKKGPLGNITKHGHDSNISLDSLSSPAKNAKNFKARPTINEMDVSIDSLAESLKSNSLKTNSTLSHESLIYQEYFKTKETNLEKPQQTYSKSNPMIFKDRTNGPKSIDSLTVNKTTSQAKSNLKPSGPSSSRLGPSKPAPAGINRTASSASVSSTSSSSFVKKSFLSQRSREILARRSTDTKSNSTNSSNKSAASSPSLMSRDKSTASSDIAKSGSSASITTHSSGTRKVFNTTLHLRKTAKLQADSIPTAKQTNESNKFNFKNSHIPIAGGGQSRKSTATVNRSNSSSSTSGGVRSMKNVTAVMMPAPAPAPASMHHHVGNNIHGDAYTSSSSDSSNSSAENHKPLRVESKLERSNTFCMEASDNPVVLQIVE